MRKLSTGKVGILISLVALMVGSVALADLVRGSVARAEDPVVCVPLSDRPSGWFCGNVNINISAGAGRLDLVSGGDINALADHIRLMSRNGGFEFETYTPEANLSSYTIGTSTRIPLAVGGEEGQDVTSLVVRGKYGQAKDLTVWLPGRSEAAAVDGWGRLRLNGVILFPMVDSKGKVRLYAILPDGKRQLLLATK